VDEVLRPERGEEKPDHWASHFLKRLSRPTWQTRHENLPTLAQPSELQLRWKIRWGPGDEQKMDTHAFECTPKAVCRYLGVAVPQSGRPAAWLIYFRHTARKKDFNNNLLEMGAGDYLIGRMQAVKQIALSKKSVGVIIPIAIGSSGEFAGNQPFVTQCLREVETSLYGNIKETVLLAASNSDGILELDKFLKGCPTLKGRLKGIYDFDGELVTRARGVSLSGTKARVFRYVGAGSPHLEHFNFKESEESFLARTMSQNPCRVPLALSRWRAHPRFGEVRPGAHPDARTKRGDPMNEVRPGNQQDQNYLHHHIPTCMLHHGLMHTPGI
jgi:hypothetical protein